MQAATISLAAVVTMVAVVRAARRRTEADASAGNPPAVGDRLVPGRGTEGSALAGAAVGRGSETASWVATTG
ncbi:hypothetical protein GCM10017556_57570 [Micromonospora sagamiensis]|uniref:Uncharacterized protein n=1 Tax=Micromonospora sagamiensis TaxID=47875 RepID=A0A562WFJ4_9ACTN|nr:hypothetical protein JD81_02464 [Micromonospora sagamiensis]BCL18018.1 hypothetical protein GCM10017556_57570 [Micromonospora sagamiensis]